MEILWIFAGIIFIVYKLCKESKWFNQLGKPRLSSEQQASFDREKELANMSDEHIGNLIGIPYQLIPNDNCACGYGLTPFGINRTLKRMCAESFVIKKEGLSCYSFVSTGNDTYQVSPCLVLEGEYGKEFEKFVNDT
mgnify:CR=1 FL=1